MAWRGLMLHRCRVFGGIFCQCSTPSTLRTVHGELVACGSIRVAQAEGPMQGSPRASYFRLRDVALDSLTPSVRPRVPCPSIPSAVAPKPNGTQVACRLRRKGQTCWRRALGMPDRALPSRRERPTVMAADTTLICPVSHDGNARPPIFAAPAAGRPA